MRHALILALALLMGVNTARAECECVWEGSFVDVHGGADLIVSGTVRTHRGNAVDVSVDHILRGREHLDEIRVWMQTGSLCRPKAEEFPPGSSWVMALHRISEVPPGGFDPDTPNQSFGREFDYFLSSCGGYWLSLRGGRVTGNLIAAPRWEYDPPMTPVLLDLVEDYVNEKLPREALADAARRDPALQELMLDTRGFLRGHKE